MQVKDIMSSSVRSVSATTSMIEAVSLMCLYRFSGLPVVDDDDKLIGIISEKDVLYRLLPNADETMENMATIDFDGRIAEYSEMLKHTVGDLMTSNVISVAPSMHILKAAAAMASRRFRRIPVAEGGKLVGMLSLGDVHKAIFHQNLSSNALAR